MSLIKYGIVTSNGVYNYYHLNALNQLKFITGTEYNRTSLGPMTLVVTEVG